MILQYFKKNSTVLFLVIYLIFIFFILSSYKNYSVSWDEQYHLVSGKYQIENLLSPKKSTSAISNYDLLTHGSFFDMVYFSPLKLFHQEENYELLHLIKALFSSLTLIFIFLSLKKVSSKWFTPIIGVVLLILFPRWLGDIFDNHMDVIAALLYSIQIYLALIILTRKKEQNKYLFIIFGIISAIVFSHRMILFTVQAVLLVFYILKTKRIRWSLDFVKPFLFFAVSFLIALIIIDPAVRSFNPLIIVQRIIYSLRFRWTRTMLFESRQIFARDLPWYYLPKWIAITTPIITIVLLLNGLIITLKRKNLIDYFLPTVLFFPIILVVILHPVIYDGWRQFIFLSVPLVMVAALGFEYVLVRKNSLFKIFASLILVIGFITTTIGIYRLHPFEYIYFNGMVGGLKGAFEKYETDYWSKSYREAALWLEKNEIRDKSKIYNIYSCDFRYSASYYFSKNMKLVDSLKEADYAICFTRWNADKKIPGKVIYIVEREGTPLSFVKKLE